jgi:hypothetical protein
MPHLAPADFSTAWPPSIRPVRPSPVLCTRSPTHVTVLVAARYAAPATCTLRDKQTRFSERNKGKRKTKQNCAGFEFKPREVNDSSQSKQGTDYLISQHLPSKHRQWSGEGAGPKEGSTAAEDNECTPARKQRRVVLCLRGAAAAHAPVARQEVLHGEALGLCAASRFPGKVS